MIMTHIHGNFPIEYIPTVWDVKVIYLPWGKYSFSCSIWDYGHGELNPVRKLTLGGTTCNVICYPVDDPGSFERVRTKWKDVVKAVKAPFILVATKVEFRDDERIILDLQQRGEDPPISKKMGLRCAKDIGAVEYLEVSSKTSVSSVQKVFEAVTKYGVRHSYVFVVKKRLLLPKKVTSAINTTEMKVQSALEKAWKKYSIVVKASFEKDIAKHREFQKIFEPLSYDVMLMILREFVVIEIDKTVEHSRKYEMFLDVIGHRRENILFQFFGYFPSDREKVMQIFFSFKCVRKEFEKVLPLRRLMVDREEDRVLYDLYHKESNQLPFKVLAILRKPNLSAGNFHECFSQPETQRYDISNLQEIGFSFFNQYCNDYLMKSVKKWKFIDKLKKMTLKINGESFPSSYLFFDQVSEFTNLETLVLHNYGQYVLQIQFEKFPNVQNLRIDGVGMVRCDAFKTIVTLKKLRKLELHEITFQKTEDGFFSLLLQFGENLQGLNIEDCSGCWDVFTKLPELIRNLPNLMLLRAVDDVNDHKIEEVRKKTMEEVGKRKTKLKFFVRSVSEINWKLRDEPPSILCVVLVWGTSL